MRLHKSWVFLAYEDIEPLIRGNLTIEERLLCQFHIAVTLIHETAVGSGSQHRLTETDMRCSMLWDSFAIMLPVKII